MFIEDTSCICCIEQKGQITIGICGRILVIWPTRGQKRKCCNSCWQAGPAELEAEDLDEALADARVLRNWGEAAVEQVDKYQSC